jgi:hypothetical protein
MTELDIVANVWSLIWWFGGLVVEKLGFVD